MRRALGVCLRLVTGDSLWDTGGAGGASSRRVDGTEEGGSKGPRGRRREGQALGRRTDLPGVVPHFLNYLSTQCLAPRQAAGGLPRLLY